MEDFNFQEAMEASGWSFGDITKETFYSYEDVRVSGVTNMLDVKFVSELSGLDEDLIMFIMKNYSELAKRYKEA